MANHIHMIPGISIPVYFYNEVQWAKSEKNNAMRTLVGGGAFSMTYLGEKDLEGNEAEDQPYSEYIGKPMIFLGQNLISKTTPEQIQAIAWHEEGHCVLGHIKQEQPLKIIIDPRKEVEANRFAFSKGASKKDLKIGIQKSIQVINETQAVCKGIPVDHKVTKGMHRVVKTLVALSPDYWYRLFAMRKYA